MGLGADGHGAAVLNRMTEEVQLLDFLFFFFFLLF
jgi:hypothetical protein